MQRVAARERQALNNESYGGLGFWGGTNQACVFSIFRHTTHEVCQPTQPLV